MSNKVAYSNILLQRNVNHCYLYLPEGYQKIYSSESFGFFFPRISHLKLQEAVCRIKIKETFKKAVA